MRVIRVFPRKTKATPTDELAVWPCRNNPQATPGLFHEADEIHISVTFTWDMSKAERMARQWCRVAPVKIGGPAYRKPAGEFTPGQYLRPGYVVTSRGCPNRCWFCWAWRSQNGLQELAIADGWNVLDDNLLACSEKHIRAVFAMLKRQKRRVEFTGGLEALRLRDWHVDLLAELHPRPACFFAYDTPDDLEPLRVAGQKMLAAGFTRESHRLRCYVLIGCPGDTMGQAECRLGETMRAGFMPMAMLWRDEDGSAKPEWRRFQREWARPAIIAAKLREVAR
jgi:hypothetical protein